MVCTKLHSKGLRWRCRWVDETGKEESLSFDKRAAADGHVKQVGSDLHTGPYIDPAAGRVTFRDYPEAWRERQVHRDSSAEHLESRLLLHTYPGGR